ncbi:tetratricopeptide repeat-containing glycosyltransferase family protein [Azospirillum sp.]|uniref:tetratricopeptide repeat-containing glycosyltransferase family protein n=1 Tax=Azospirillum sp. TaxID=34012 RepID=UPI002D732B69|nr:tetratricopeptide repeat-containing glycosyltransferase family protein [Azospirillum sp.]HYD63842.1 tetratricopeptide repeat-containing glycosyltransferase family protein [Azospirillum sp.]
MTERLVTIDAALEEARRELARGRFDRAIGICRQVEQAKPGHIRAADLRAKALQRLERFDEAVVLLRRVVASEPRLAKLLFNLGNALRNSGDMRGALAIYRRAARVAPHVEKIRVGLALTLLQIGEWEEGFDEYERRSARQQVIQAARAAEVPMWDGSPLDGRTIVLVAEQGVGDTIHFLRYASLLAAQGAEVRIHAQPGLRRLIPTVPGVAGIVEGRIGSCDFIELLMSLPHRLATRPDTVPANIPYISAPAQAPIRLESTGRLRVGLVWAGNPAHVRDRWRSIPFARFARLLDVAGVDFYALQKAGAVETSGMRNLGPLLDDFADTAAVIEQLDLVISVDTSVAHLAGALGKPVWILLARNADWRWLVDRDDTPWYPTARLFRQDRLGDWDGVLARVAQELRVLMGR